LRIAEFLALILVALPCGGCLVGRVLYFNTPSLAAPSYFDGRVVRASNTPVPLEHGAAEAVFPLSDAERAEYGSFDELLEAERTCAFVATHDDAIVYERYFCGVSASTQLPAFSMSKAYAAALIGSALSDGLLPSLEVPVTSYVPELAGKSRYREVTLEHLLRMTSGIDFDEESLATPKFYYTTDLRDLMYAYDVERTPGTHYLYGSVNIQLLWDVLQRRLAGETVSHYFERRLWRPLGAESPASWSLDSAESGVEKFFGGFNATARDHARLGLLFLHGGSWNGQQILAPAWVERALSPDPVAGLLHTADGCVRRGTYQWFLTRDLRAYFAKGYHGQYVFVVPDRRWVFVRFGEGYGDTNWPALFLRLADNVQLNQRRVF
jgi:CubicO group peptidase (beta-lactamase class C family)